jgi:5-hydroxyisourate hydrolase-like protein (transthyretin family)
MWHFTTAPEPAALQVVAPNGYERWPVGLPHEIIWARGPEKSVKIELLHDSGSGYSVYQTIDADTDNDGTYDWTPAATVSNGNYRIRITATTDAGQTDDSDSDFMVTTGLAVTVTSPDGGDVWRMGSTHTIQWASSGIASNLNIELYTTINGYTQLERVVAADVPNSGSYNWKIPTDERVDGHYLIAVSSVDYPEVSDFSDAVFTLTNAVALELTAPIPNARWSKESSRLIKWDTVGSVPHVDLYLLKSGTDTLIEKNVANTNGYLWTIPDSLATGDDYRIFIQGYEDQSVSNVSGCFAITPKAGTITLATPESGARCEIGDVVTVKWDDENVIGPLKLELWSYGHYAATIVTNLTDSGSYDWRIDTGMPTGAVSQVRIVDCGNPDTYGLSAVFDLEQPAYLRLTSPDGGEAWQINRNHQITWVSSNMSDCIRIDLYENTELAKSIVAETRNTGSYVWSTSDLYPGTHYRVKISSCYHADINDMSDAEFELVKPLPEKPFYPSPSDGAGGVPATAVFSARFGSYTETCDVYFGTNNPPTTMILTNVPSASFRACNMEQLQTYYWQVTARNSTGTMPGPVWQFTTRREPLRISAITRVSGGLRIEWNPVGKVLRYHVFGSDSLTNAFQDLGTCTTNSILEPGGSNTLHYFYRITADPQ